MRLSPVLVLSGKKGSDIADGFHRVSLVHQLDPFAEVPLKLGQSLASSRWVRDRATRATLYGRAVQRIRQPQRPEPQDHAGEARARASPAGGTRARQTTTVTTTVTSHRAAWRTTPDPRAEPGRPMLGADQCAALTNARA